VKIEKKKFAKNKIKSNDIRFTWIDNMPKSRSCSNFYYVSEKIRGSSYNTMI